MSITLKGIDLPKEDEWLEVIIKPTKEVIVDTIRYRDNALLKTEYGSAIQIPTPHGRLIDRDDIYIGRWDIDTDLAEQIQNAPTILEAEE